MPVPEDNPITEEKIELGRRLFNDRRLSRDGTIACSSCHDPAMRSPHRRQFRHGVFGRRGPRNAPALINRGWGRSFSGTAASPTLEEQVLKPIEDPDEMDLPIAEARHASASRRENVARVGQLMSARIISGNSPFDRFVNGDRPRSHGSTAGYSLSRQGQLHGLSRRTDFTDERSHNTGVAWRPATERPDRFVTKVARGHRTSRGSWRVQDADAARGCATAPYMHDGTLARSTRSSTITIAAATRHALLDRNCARWPSLARRNTPCLSFCDRYPEPSHNRRAHEPSPLPQSAKCRRLADCLFLTEDVRKEGQ